MPGLFIAFEGGDGVGKSTQVDLLATWLTEQGREVVRSREPGGTPLGAGIRRLLLDNSGDFGAVDPHAEALLYAADRAQHVRTLVRPALERGAVVVQDRYIDSSLAYQGAGRVLEVARVREISEWATGGLWPDLTVLLDLDEAAARERRATRGGASDRLEAEGDPFHGAVRQGFRDFAAADPGRYLTIDASRPIAEIHGEVRARVLAMLR